MRKQGMPNVTMRSSARICITSVILAPVNAQIQGPQRMARLFKSERRPRVDGSASAALRIACASASVKPLDRVLRALLYGSFTSAAGFTDSFCFSTAMRKITLTAARYFWLTVRPDSPCSCLRWLHQSAILIGPTRNASSCPRYVISDSTLCRKSDAVRGDLPSERWSRSHALNRSLMLTAALLVASGRSHSGNLFAAGSGL